METYMKIRIEIQYFTDCPNSPILIKRVKEAIKGFDFIEYRELIIDSNEKAEELKFRGSPTLLINGKDYEDQPAPESPALACRYYLEGLPTVDQIKSRILEF